MSTHITVVGKDSDENIELKRRAYQACVEAGVDIPEELYELFNQDFYSTGKEVDIPYRLVRKEGCTLYVVDLKNIPKGVEQMVFGIHT